MKWKNNGERGMSLVEVTIILMVLALLTAVVAPTLGNYVNDARRVKAQEDTEAIGLAIIQMLKDVGAPFPLIDPLAVAADRFDMANRVELLVSAGNTPGTSASAPAVAAVATSGPVAERNWANTVTGTSVQLLENHVVSNPVGYVFSVQAADGQIGWRGPYIIKIANGDPWGYRYAANTLYLGWATDATLADLGWNQDAIVISAGPNGVIETPFNRASGPLLGDDIGMVMSAATK